MIYLASGVVCMCVGGAYVLGLFNGFNNGYNAAIDDLEQLSLQLKKEIEKQKNNEE